MADSKINSADDAVDFPFYADYKQGTGWSRFIKTVFDARFVGENFRVRLVTQKEKRNSVPDYSISFLVLWHLTDMEYHVDAPSIYEVAKKFTNPDWLAARLVLMRITQVSNKGDVQIRFDVQ